MITKSRQLLLNELMDKLGYCFKDIELLNCALIHRSYLNENKDVSISNERLEFLGDSVVGLVITENLYNSFEEYDEGVLTKIRSKIVCEDSFAFVSKNFDIGKYLLLGKGESSFGGRKKKSILADAFEAIFGAIYLDGGFPSVKNVLETKFLEDMKNRIKDDETVSDYKSSLQEYYHKNTNLKIKYLVDKEVGPDHDKTFYISVSVNEKVLGLGTGRNKKQAEQDAAKNALFNLGVIYE